MRGAYPDRRFQLWEYRVSHGSLLIRSPKGPEVATNVDLIFDGVEYVSCPRMLRGIELVSPSLEDLHQVPPDVRPVQPPDRLFVLASSGVRHLVVASSCRVEEHEGDIFDSPFV